MNWINPSGTIRYPQYINFSLDQVVEQGKWDHTPMRVDGDGKPKIGTSWFSYCMVTLEDGKKGSVTYSKDVFGDKFTFIEWKDGVSVLEIKS